MVSSYPPPPIGIATYTKFLCRALASRGVKVVVLSNRTPIKKPGVTVVKAWDGPTLSPLRLLKSIASVKPDIIHIQHEYWFYGRGVLSTLFPTVLVLLKALMRPIIVTLHCVIPRAELTGSFFEKHRLGNKMILAKKLYLTFYNVLLNLLATRTIVHSNIAKDILIIDYAFNRRKLRVIPHGAHLTTNMCYINNWSEKSHKLLVFGQIRRGKGIEYIIRAMPEIMKAAPCKLIIAGLYNVDLSPESAGYLEEIRDLVMQLGLNGCVDFKLNVAEEKVKDLFSVASVIVLPYIENEIIAASGPVLTAMSFGKPIVATRLRRFTGYLRNGENALLVEPAKPSELAKAVISILSNGELRKRLSRSALKSVETISWRRVAKQTLSIYQELIKG
jgi:glycosyltransferase involved in cell wall biosynthesis